MEIRLRLKQYFGLALLTLLVMQAATPANAQQREQRRRRHPSSPSSTSTTPPVAAAPSSGVGAQIAGDMQGANEGHPHGVPSDWDWANGPAMEMGNNSNGWRAVEAWGLIYVASEGSKAVNTRVNIRDMQLFVLSASKGTWSMIQGTSTPTGAHYVENFSNDENIPADIIKLSDGTISVTAGGGYCFHFYPDPRASIDPSDIGGIVVVYQARLITADPTRTDDRSSARFVADAGADYYPGLTGNCPVGDNGGCPGVAIGKMKYVTNDWRSFAMSTASQSQLTNNPPPVDLSGVLP
ncbi:MAG TPA: hypothetical protein VGM43_08735 [Bryobacteraceae bacterium]